MSPSIDGSHFIELEKFQCDLDEVIDCFDHTSRHAKELADGGIRPRIDSYIEDGKLVIRADMPGIDPKIIEVNVTGKLLNVRAKREQKKESTKLHFLRREVQCGSYQYSTSLPEGIKAENFKTSYRDGVFELIAALPKELAPRKVMAHIETAEPRKVETKA